MKAAMSPKNEVTLPLLLGLAGIVSPYLLPSSEIVEKFLISYLKYKWSLWGAKALFGVIVFLLPYYFYQRVINYVSPKKQEKVIKLMKDDCNSKYILRYIRLLADFDAIWTDCSSRGFDIPPGSAFAKIADLYVRELDAYTDILLDTILRVLDSGKFKIKTDSLVSLSKEMILHKADEFNSYFSSLIDHHSQFHQGPQPDIMICSKTSFTAQIGKIAEFNIAKMSSHLELKNMA